MNVKLTLSVRKSTIEKARAIARLHNKSISGMVEDYFEYLSLSEKRDENIPVSSTLSSLIGCLKAPIPEDYKKELETILVEKYNNE